MYILKDILPYNCIFINVPLWEGNEKVNFQCNHIILKFYVVKKVHVLVQIKQGSVIM